MAIHGERIPASGRGGAPLKQNQLAEIVSDVAGGAKIIVVSNREPVIHIQADDGIRTTRPASGMVSAVEPIVRAVHGTWVAHGSGSADRLTVDCHDRVGVPQTEPAYNLRRVWLSPADEAGYYYGISNSAIWPMCHVTYTRPEFRRADWQHYKAVNQRFCEVVLEEASTDQAIIFIQDYHLALLPRMLKERRPDLLVALFWHIPWPNRESFRVFPWGEELLDGILGSDLLGFHIQYHCNNFLDTVDRGIEAKVDYERFCVYRGGHPTSVRPFPISVDFAQIQVDARSESVNTRIVDLLSRHLPQGRRPKLIVGMDRIDYTKGIIERLQAFDLLLGLHAEHHGGVCLMQFAAPSRTKIGAYQHLDERVVRLAEDINRRHGRDDWLPVHLLRAHHDYYTVLAAYRLADILIVTSLHDGMNLVSKEFVSARWDEGGVLILSRFTGAARELEQAIHVNPYDLDDLADKMHHAMLMPLEEVSSRMRRSREAVATHNVYDWGARIFQELRR